MTCWWGSGQLKKNKTKLDEVLDLRLSLWKAKQNERHVSL